jgi:hypothetical protein
MLLRILKIRKLSINNNNNSRNLKKNKCNILIKTITEKFMKLNKIKCLAFEVMRNISRK